MADIEINGKQITFDLNKITRKEYKGIFNPTEAENDSDATLAKCAGLTADDVDNMSALEFKAFFQAFLRKCQEPLKNPS